MNKEQEYELRYLKAFEKYGYRPHQKIMSFGYTDYTPSQFAKKALRNQEYELYILEHCRSKEEFDEYVEDNIKCNIPWYEKEDRAILHAKLINDIQKAKEWEKKKRIKNIFECISGAIMLILFLAPLLALAISMVIGILHY